MGKDYININRNGCIPELQRYWVISLNFFLVKSSDYG